MAAYGGHSQVLLTRSLGQLVLEDLRVGDKPYYIYTGSAVLNGAEVEIVVWPPAKSLGADELVRRVERFWARLSVEYPAIVLASYAVLDEAISEFCEPDEDDLPPTARTLIIASELQVVKIDLTGEPKGTHEIGYSDKGNLIGGHDIFIYLDEDLRPSGAYMDG